ncbi:hypothetical protein SAMN06297229_0637 [Pseudidiomarina planktonica]|uniref:FlgO domain-containing protein n=1 Tax=Pseudidiomarina planktonica TaxID=1323738 RepID=A0A1Y6EH47_9GAMM|nr:FlgO family outer membrane protein [Pseudidiomarina planktonica]SMQ61948.1 hypothetical protein SAMN06297229_0637 [Pseudidiomarina planktonica]
MTALLKFVSSIRMRSSLGACLPAVLVVLLLSLPGAAQAQVEGFQSAAAKLSTTLAAQLQNSAYAEHGLALTSMVDAHTLSLFPATDSLAPVGQQLTEAMYTELGQRQVNLIDVRGRNYIEINPQAELNLSRELANLNPRIRADLVLVATMARRDHGVMVHTRILTLRDQQVVASASEYLAKRLYWNQRQVEIIDGMPERTTANGGIGQ